MRALFRPLGCLCILVILVCAFFLSVPLTRLATELDNLPIQSQVEELLGQANDLSPQLVRGFFEALSLPSIIAFPQDTGSIANSVIYSLLGALLVGVALWFSRKSIKSKSFADDFVSLVLLYFAFRVTAGIWAGVFPALIELQNQTIAVLVSVWIVISMFRARGMDDSRIFFRTLAQLFLIALFTLPTQTATVISNSLRLLSRIGGGREFPTIFQGVALFVTGLAVYVVYGSSKPAGKSTNAILEETRNSINELIDKAKTKD